MATRRAYLYPPSQSGVGAPPRPARWLRSSGRLPSTSARQLPRPGTAARTNVLALVLTAAGPVLVGQSEKQSTAQAAGASTRSASRYAGKKCLSRTAKCSSLRHGIRSARKAAAALRVQASQAQDAVVCSIHTGLQTWGSTTSQPQPAAQRSCFDPRRYSGVLELLHRAVVAAFRTPHQQSRAHLRLPGRQLASSSPPCCTVHASPRTRGAADSNTRLRGRVWVLPCPGEGSTLASSHIASCTATAVAGRALASRGLSRQALEGLMRSVIRSQQCSLCLRSVVQEARRTSRVTSRACVPRGAVRLCGCASCLWCCWRLHDICTRRLACNRHILYSSLLLYSEPTQLLDLIFESQ